MIKITEYYLDKASYIAIDEKGRKFKIKVDYWQGKFKVSKRNPQLEKYAEKLVKKKHKVNYVAKMYE